MAELAFGVSLYNQVCFHAHQAAEKTLKALIVYNEADSPKTHRLTELLMLLQDEEPTLGELASELRSLESYYIPTRYPEEIAAVAPDVKVEKAQEVLSRSREFMQWLSSISQ